MNKLRMLMLSVLLLTWAGSCKKTQNGVVPIAPALSQNFNFGVGTYWVYLDSASGTIDSYSVTKVTQQIIPYSPIQSASIISCHIIKNGDTQNIGYWILEYNTIDFGFLINDSFSMGYSPLFIYPFTYDTIINTSPFQISVINFYPNLYVSNILYSNVTEIKQHGYYDTDSPFNDYFYIKDTIGIVKIVYDHPTRYFVWNLARYNIVP